MHIGILGSGEVGRTVGAGLIALGHEVTIGSRTPESDKLKLWREGVGRRGFTGHFHDAATSGEMILLAVRWSGLENAIHLARPSALAGKVVMDATNPIDFSRGEPVALEIGPNDSAGERVQRWLPDSYVVKAFNHVAAKQMVNPTFPGGPPDMFICGEDAEAKEKVVALLFDLGWPVIDIGGIQESRLLEAAAMLWIKTALKVGSWAIAFKLLRKA